jgi:hypothetical protein
MTPRSSQPGNQGWSFKFYIGINLSSQDGWTADSALTYDLSKRGAICGVHNTPNGNHPSAGELDTH